MCIKYLQNLAGSSQLLTRHCLLHLQLLSALAGARWLTSNGTVGIDTKHTPILLVVDNKHVRRYIHNGVLPGIVGPSSIDSVHSASDEVTEVAPHMSTYVDIYLLANAQCFVYTQSGFSFVALWIGNHSCRLFGKDAMAIRQ